MYVCMYVCHAVAGAAYSLAVGSACSMAFGLGKLFERGPRVLLAR
jgi:hypothetical protein